MKRTYRTPTARKVDYVFQEQVTAVSYPISNYADPWRADKCTWGDGSCSIVFNVKARGLDDCSYQGQG